MPTPQHCIGLPPVATPSARVLIVGSLPGAESLRRGQYYAHPRNAFWPIMGALVGAGPELPYRARLQRLRAAGIALWDVVHSARRAGSADATIAYAVPNDLARVLDRGRHIAAVVCNGRTAHALLWRCVAARDPQLLAGHEVHCFPSTSPAYAAMPFAAKLRAWRALQRWLDHAAVAVASRSQAH